MRQEVKDALARELEDEDDRHYTAIGTIRHKYQRLGEEARRQNEQRELEREEHRHRAAIPAIQVKYKRLEEAMQQNERSEASGAKRTCPDCHGVYGPKREFDVSTFAVCMECAKTTHCANYCHGCGDAYCNYCCMDDPENYKFICGYCAR